MHMSRSPTAKSPPARAQMQRIACPLHPSVRPRSTSVCTNTVDSSCVRCAARLPTCGQVRVFFHCLGLSSDRAPRPVPLVHGPDSAEVAFCLTHDFNRPLLRAARPTSQRCRLTARVFPRPYLCVARTVARRAQGSSEHAVNSSPRTHGVSVILTELCEAQCARVSPVDRRVESGVGRRASRNGARAGSLKTLAAAPSRNRQRAEVESNPWGRHFVLDPWD
ncbi:hypothetical protein B0H10DRAFT_2085421 [Mycena sp. CBHHK59/15]|nr:hypothetical protein B0H10DRAFT_2085421 [Mycena sp. CBHHK59/15]